MNQFIADSKSLGDLFLRTCGQFASNTAMVYPDGKSHQSLTYAQLINDVASQASALESLGLKKGDRVCIIGETCREWAIVDWACQCLGLISVPIYPTLPPDQTQYIVRNSGALVVVCSSAVQVEKVKFLEGVKAITWDKLWSPSPFAVSDLALRAAQVDKNDTATIIYTSGTTGSPKGVELTHGNFISLSACIQEGFPVDEKDRFFVFLPLAHVFARYAGHVLPVAIGASVVYAGSVATIATDLVKTHPTVVLCVPRFLESVKSRIMDGVEKSPPSRQRLFHWTLSQGVARYRKKFAPLAGLLDKIVGSKLREKVGGSVRFFVSGGAALPPAVNEFYNAFRLIVIQGYGLTETTAATCINRPWDNRAHTVGPPFAVVELKIASDGEILQRGASVMKGYYNLPEDTANAIDKDGWFHSGDIGELEDGHLKITDRKKDLLVLGNGKNIAPLHIEGLLKQSEYIAEAVLFGDGMEYCCALVLPDFDRVKTWLSSVGVTESNPQKIVLRDDVRELIKKEISNANANLADFEKVKKHCLLSVTFSVEGGELTPSLKVKRRVVKEKFSAEIESMKR